MRSISSYPVTGFQFRRGLAGLPGLIASLLLLIAVSLSPAHALEIPSDEEQDVLIRSTLMTFNDANMTGNYTVLLAKASKQFQSQYSAEQAFAAFEAFRKNQLFFEAVVTAEYEFLGEGKIRSGRRSGAGRGVQDRRTRSQVPAALRAKQQGLEGPRHQGGCH